MPGRIVSELRAATGHHTKIAASDGDLLSELLDEEDRSGKVEGVASELQRQLALLSGSLIPERGLDRGEQREATHALGAEQQ